MKYAVIVILVCLLVLVCQDAFTDILYLTNGTRREGMVVHQDEKKVVLRIGDEKDGVDVAFSREEVLRIDKMGEAQVIEVSLAEGPTVKISPPLISEAPLFINQTKPIIADEEQSVDVDERGLGSEKAAPSLDTPAESTVDTHLVHDAESARIEEKETEIQETLKKYLDQANSTYSNHHH